MNNGITTPSDAFYAEEKYGAMHEILGDIVYKISPDGKFEYVNGAVRNIGYEPSELIGRHFSVIIHPEYIEAVSRELLLPKYKGKKTGDERAPKLFDERRTGARMTKNLEVKLIPKDWNSTRDDKSCIMGHAITSGEVSASGIYENEDNEIHQGKFAGTIGLIRDITEKLRAEEELKKTERLESLGIVAGGIAHDFNNLLTGIFGHLQLAKECSKDNPLVSNYLDGALRGFELAKNLTFQLLTFAKGGTPVCSLVRIKDVLSEACSLSLSGTNISCTWNLDDDLKLLEADKNQLVQLFSNILINARQAMPDGGDIEITGNNITIDSSAPPAPETALLVPGSYVSVRIKDRGPGIPEELLTKIFDPFFTTKPHGTGLGLAVSYSIAKKHGGLIHALSRPGDGSSFTVLLPSIAAVQVEESHGKTPPAHHGKGHILIMDDEPLVLETISEILKYAGYTTVKTKLGETAIEEYRKAEAAGLPFDAVILDLTVLGGLGGEKTIAELKKMDPDVSAIVASGYSDNPVMANYKSYGFFEMLSKPFLSNELLSKTAASVAFRRRNGKSKVN